MKHVHENISAVIIASGFSKRAGGLKPLLSFGGFSFLAGIALKVSVFCKDIVVVLGHEEDKIKKSYNEEIKNLLINSELSDAAELLQSKLRFVTNKNYEAGMFSSLQKGVGDVNSSTDWIIYHFVDQPSLSLKFYSEFLQQLDSSYDWIQPAFNNAKGHPIIFNKTVANSVLAADMNSNLRSVLRERKFSTKIWNTSNAQVSFDVDTAEDYRLLLNSFAQNITEKELLAFQFDNLESTLKSHIVINPTF
ncbi:MAG: NTP transferase domain-containing protein [Bacteroidetes bacterium]|nr:NTP transferase domain-containing protein [Bacteroidota bacterium]